MNLGKHIGVHHLYPFHAMEFHEAKPLGGKVLNHLYLARDFAALFEQVKMRTERKILPDHELSAFLLQ
jgi:hypothetical protein